MSSHPASPPTSSDSASPAGTLAFLFTDIEGSTRLWERLPDAMPTSLSQHDRILRAAVEDQGGRVVKTTGDGLMAVFSTARQGLAACLGAQLALEREAWAATGPLRVRMGLHVGEGAREGADFHGQSVNRAARIMAAGHGGQVLLSAATAALVIDRLPEGVSLRDLGEHRLKDLSRPERVFQLVHPDLPETFPPLSTVDERRHSLPAEPSAFVGRDAERARVREHLVDGSIRLLTLIGPGGIGKTRLALRAARDVEDRFEDGAVFIDLSAARDASGLLMTISRELGLPDASEGAQLDELAAGIGRQHLLLVLDNFEQVAKTAPTLSRLLADCPRLTLLVTSREALHVRGERLFSVPPMTLPDRALKTPSAEQVAAFEAVQLFVERARTVRPDFRVTDANAAVLAEICRRLEGVPLAIELATARLRVYSLEALRDRLDSQLRALGSGARDLPERQQTLRATIEWSYQLLSPGEQRLLDVLACFAGTDVEAVEAVARGLGPWLADIDPIDGVVSLVDKSLVRRIDRGDEEPRFEMTASVLEFAAERLEASPELAAQARSAHAAYYASWVAQGLPGLDGPGRADVLERFATEADNLRLAWRRCAAERDLARLEVLIQGLRPLYDTRGWYRGVSDLAGDMLAVLDELPPSAERALTAVLLRSDQARALAATEGYTEEVEAAYERLRASLKGPDVPQLFPVLRGLATFHMFRIENDKAAELARRILVLAEQEGDVAMHVAGRLALGSSLSFVGRLGDGIGELEAGVRWFETHAYDGDWFRLGPDPRVGCLTALSLLRWWEGSIDRSVERSGQAVDLARAGGHPSSLGYGLHHASLLRLWRGEPEAARDHAVQAVEVATEHDLHIWRAAGTVILGASTVALGSHEEGLRWLLEGLERYRGLRTPPVFWPFLLQVTAAACAVAGRIELGLRSVDEALGIMPAAPDLHLARGDLLVDRDPEGAAIEYEQAWAAARGWGAATSALGAAIRLCRLEAPADVSSARLERLREIVATLSEGLDSPDHVAARELLSAGK